jgi:putative tryptophan/tyrosine transport system substrate-binding protein
VKRREFITLLGGAAVWPLAAQAQQRERIRRIGVLVGTYGQTDREGQDRIAVFLDTFRRLGWSDGRNVRIETRWGAGDADRSKAFAAELVRSAPDVIVAVNNPTLAELQQLTRTIPIVFAQVSDPWAAVLSPALRGQAAISPVSRTSRQRWAASGWECSRRPRPT